MRTAITILAIACLCACATPEPTREITKQQTIKWLELIQETEEKLAKSKTTLRQLTDIELLAHTRAIQNRIQTEFTEEERNRFAESSYLTANSPQDK